MRHFTKRKSIIGTIRDRKFQVRDGKVRDAPTEDTFSAVGPKKRETKDKPKSVKPPKPFTSLFPFSLSSPINKIRDDGPTPRSKQGDGLQGPRTGCGSRVPVSRTVQGL